MGRANRILAIALGAIVVLAVIAAIVSAGRPVQTFDPASPEGTVQRYLDAALHGRPEQAASLLAPGGACGVDDLRSVAGQAPPARVVLVDSSVSGDTATVHVELAYGGGGPFEPEGPGEQHTYQLTRSGPGGQWRLTGVPWPLYDCWPKGGTS